MRAEFCRDMQFAGVEVDEGRNAAAVGGQAADISAPGSRVKVQPSTCLSFFPPCLSLYVSFLLSVHPQRLLHAHACRARAPPHAATSAHTTRTTGRAPCPPTPPPQVLVLPTDEELSIAQQTLEVIEKARGVGARAA